MNQAGWEVSVGEHLDTTIAICSLSGECDIHSAIVRRRTAGEVVVIIRSSDSEGEHQLGIRVSERLTGTMR